MKLRQATIDDVDSVATLFDQYRQFYQCSADIELARKYIGQRITGNESIIFIASNETGKDTGFVQLYPSFCSVEAIRIMILYDLFVAADFRRQGIARYLMQRATTCARESGASRIDLLTGKQNLQGQALYESLGYQQANIDFIAYSLAV